MDKLHGRIRRLRKRAEMTQEALALALGVHKTAVSHWEVGQSLPRAGTLERLAAALGVKVSELYGETKR